MYWHRNPHWLFKLVYPRFEWFVPTRERTVYLTFDDGPVPGPTEWVLDQLARYGIKGTFFCVGDNVRKHPHIFNRILDEGHSVGNHTFNHLNGRRTPTPAYLENVVQAQQAMQQAAIMPMSRPLFRPPYGRMTKEQAQGLLPDYRIIMWDVLSGDFDPNLQPETCLAKTLAGTRNGSIIVFHDSPKAMPRLQHVLPRYIEALQKKGYGFKTL